MGDPLPAFEAEQVEIVRIRLASVKPEQISVMAIRAGQSITYSVVDDYETVYRRCISETAEPLTLAELIALIDGTEHSDEELVTGGLVNSHWNFLYAEGTEPAKAVHFVGVESRFYSGLAGHYLQEAEEWLAARKTEEEDEDEDQR